MNGTYDDIFPCLADLPFISNPFPVAMPNIIFFMASSDVGLHTVNTFALQNKFASGLVARFSSMGASPPSRATSLKNFKSANADRIDRMMSPNPSRGYVVPTTMLSSMSISDAKKLSSDLMFVST